MKISFYFALLLLVFLISFAVGADTPKEEEEIEAAITWVCDEVPGGECALFIWAETGESAYFIVPKEVEEYYLQSCFKKSKLWKECTL